MTKISIFETELFDRVSGAPMRLSAWRGPDAATLPFSLDADSARWTMTVNEASRLSMAACRVQHRLEWAARKKEGPKAGAQFRRKLSSDDDAVQAVIELGLVATGEIIAVYFEFAGMRIHLGAEQGSQFLALLARLGESAAELHKVLHSEQTKFDLLAPPDWGFDRSMGWE